MPRCYCLTSSAEVKATSRRMCHKGCTFKYLDIKQTRGTVRKLWYTAMPVRSWASTFASFHESLSYSCLLCPPGNAMSTLLGCDPTLSGKHLVVPRLARAALSMVDFIPGRWVFSWLSGSVAFCAFSLAIFFSFFWSCAAVHMTVTALPSLRSS